VDEFIENLMFNFWRFSIPEEVVFPPKDSEGAGESAEV